MSRVLLAAAAAASILLLPLARRNARTDSDLVVPSGAASLLLFVYLHTLFRAKISPSPYSEKIHPRFPNLC